MQEQSNDYCPRCGTENVDSNKYSPEEKPYILRTDNQCKDCKHNWYYDE